MSPSPWAPFLLLSGCIYVTAALNLPPPLYQNVNSPCDIMNQVAAASSSCTRAVVPSRFWGRGDSDLQVVPSHCTCNELFHNLWSACSQMLNTHTTSPSFTTWKQACKDKQIDVDASSQWASTFRIQSTHIRRGEGQVGNSTGVMAAVATGGTTKHGWTTLQKIVPVITGVGVLILAGIAFLYYRNKKRGPFASAGLRTRLQKFLPRTKNVHKVNRSETWSIDQYETGYDDFVYVSPIAPLSPAVASSEGHNNFQPFSAISSTVKETTPNHKPVELHAERQIPGKATWRNMHLPEVLSHIPFPWKKKPIRVQHVPHTRKFRVDDVDQSTDASSSRRATSNFSHGHTTIENSSAAAFSRIHGTIEEEDESEHTSLITPLERSENSVFLISRVPGVDFSTESGSSHPRSSTVPSQIQVQSPTPTTATPSSAGVLNAPFRPNQSSPLAIPPVPTLPAPVPPESSRWRPKPIQEEEEYDLPASPPHSLSSYVSHARNHLPSQLERRPSDDSMFSPAQSSTVNEYALSGRSSPLNGYGILATPSSGHGHLSEENDFYFQRQQGHNRGPSLESLLRPSPANLPRIITHDDAVGRRPRAPSATVELQPPVGHHRNISAESFAFAPAPHDPVMLYPGAARGAGYMAQGSVSSESLYSQASQPTMKIQPNRRPSS